MDIIYDHQIFSYQRYGGISRYFYELMNYYYKHELADFEIGVKYTHNEYLRKACFLDLKYNLGKSLFNNKFFLLYLFIIYRSNKKVSQRLIEQNKFYVFHPTFYDDYFLKYLKNRPFVLTIHDMIPEKMGWEFNPWNLYSNLVTKKWINNKKYLAQKADKIIAGSENTKKDIIEYYKIDSSKISVIYYGNSLIRVKPNLNMTNLPEKYLLYVGSRADYKNFTRLITALTPLLKKHKDLFLLCTGGGNFTKNEQRLFYKNSIHNNILLHNATDSELYFYYSNAIAFVYPSLYEGFGIPILEALSSGCPCVLSNSSCFSEIAGDAAIYFDPMNVESIQKSIEKMLYDENNRSILIAKGLEVSKRFSWANTALKTLDVYKQLA
jgi:glycosyltransferase involved in cell wall biosynthesis